MATLLFPCAEQNAQSVVEFFLEREAAETMIGEVQKDVPTLAEDLLVEAIELGSR